ncbi:cold-inducible protein YdjO-related protein [Paenibacillus chungangensis]|uniref:Cold-inducible protein YdjO-related protein n=1 Tax=Paenibacillus chungangensis TaxID=696535 RepID=A0ABW3HND7_9BACL
MTTKSNDSKLDVIPTKIWKCKNSECKAWIREEFTTGEQLCPICRGPMHRSMRHLPAVKNKVPRQPRQPKNDAF